METGGDVRVGEGEWVRMQVITVPQAGEPRAVLDQGICSGNGGGGELGRS